MGCQKWLCLCAHIFLTYFWWSRCCDVLWCTLSLLPWGETYFINHCKSRMHPCLLFGISMKLVPKESWHLVAILQQYLGSLIFMRHFFFINNFLKEKANTFTILIILIEKSLQIELQSTNLLLWPPITQSVFVIFYAKFSLLEDQV